MPTKTGFRTPASRVHEVLDRWILADGMPIVYDQEGSRGSWLRDARTGEDYLDLFSFFASMPLGHNHAGLSDEAFQEKLLLCALCKPTNSDIYTQAMADFVETFARTLPAGFENLFFIEGGALAVENALKVAFDWKVRKNIAAGRSEALGQQALHFKRAFHGRSGYTLSLTNTQGKEKIQHFPKFPWPRVDVPARSFPETEASLEAVAAAEQESLRQIREAIAAHPHDIACIIVETIQGEGGDNHMRPEFFASLREICDQDEILLIFDEVQTGLGLTGSWWAFETVGTAPDIFAFGKKTQVCGIAATERVNEVDSVFKVSSRINSTWGGNLVDMVRCERYIEIIESDDLLANARSVGAYLQERLRALEDEDSRISNARGAGLMCAFDLDSTESRDKLRAKLMENHVLILPCGEKSLRFRPFLDFGRNDVDTAIQKIRSSLEAL